MDKAVRWASGAELVDAYTSGASDPIRVVKETLDAVRAVDPAVNAYCLIDEEATIRDAEASAERYRDGTPRGHMDGVPVAVKDLFLTSGWPTLRGSTLIDPGTSAHWLIDAPAVARLREAGAVLLGKVTTPEFGWKGVTDSLRNGVTRNPWDTSRTSGGSSGGSAAAVAAGIATMSIGTDGGGSIRIPAGFCGIVGLKPTFGRVPQYPSSPYGTLAHAGPMTRTVADTATLLDVISGFDSRDWWGGPAPTRSAADQIADPDLRGLRIAYSPNLGYGRNSAAVDRNTAAAIEILSGLGAQVDVVDLRWSDPAWAYHVLWFAGAAAVVATYGDDAVERIDPGLRAALDRHTGRSAADYLAATAVRMELGVEMGRLHETYDALVTPTLPDVAFAAGVDVPPGSATDDWTSWTPYSYPFNLTGQPAITVPSGVDETAGPHGLPTGLQIIGARHQDVMVLRVAAAYETARGPFGLPEV